MKYGRILMLCALMLVPTLALAAEGSMVPWVAASGNVGTTAMGDVNDVVAAINAGLAGSGLSMGEVKVGFGGGAAVGLDLNGGKWSIGLSYEYIKAATKLSVPGAGDVDLKMPANAFALNAAYYAPSSGQFEIGGGAGIGLLTSKLAVTVPGASSGDFKGNGFLIEGLVSGKWKAAESFSIVPQVGYRFAKVSKVEQSGVPISNAAGTGNLEVDYSGVFARLGFRLSFKG